MMIIGITGASGQLGSELVRLGGIPLVGRFHSDELRNSIERVSPYAIINCGGLTNVDYCEMNIAEAAATNAAGVEYLGQIFDGYLVQISTDYVFDGRAGPYGVRDTPNPIGVYGWSKLGGELVIRRHQGQSLIIRTTILFSSTNNNFVSKIVKQLKSDRPVTIYSPHLTGSPTYVPPLAAEIMRIVNAEYTGIAHIAGNRRISRYEFAKMIAWAFGYDPHTIIPSDKSIIAAPRPVRAGLICDHSGYGPINSHDVREGLLELSKKEDF